MSWSLDNGSSLLQCYVLCLYCCRVESIARDRRLCCVYKDFGLHLVHLQQQTTLLWIFITLHKFNSIWKSFLKLLATFVGKNPSFLQMSNIWFSIPIQVWVLISVDNNAEKKNFFSKDISWLLGWRCLNLFFTRHSLMFYLKNKCFANIVKPSINHCLPWQIIVFCSTSSMMLGMSKGVSLIKLAFSSI